MISYLRYLSIKAKVSYAIAHNIPIKNIQKFTITSQNSHQFKWNESNEFVFHKKLYDVFYLKKTGNQIHYYCVEDESEDKVLASIEQSFDQNQPLKSNPIQKVSKILKIKYLLTKQVCLAFNSNTKHRITFYSNPKVIERVISIELPPPQLN
jgi:tRNA U34 5-methylaminomethyl-2-thiouridine-forming methyltransferase MnmC